MLTIDTHCHVSLAWFEPVEVLLFQMDRNQVDKAVLLQTWTFDNTYLLECIRRYPGRFVGVGGVDFSRPDAPDILERGAKDGWQGVRLSLADRLKRGDALPVLKKAEQLRLVASCLGMPEQLASEGFQKIVEAVPGLPIMVEHLGYPKPDDAPAYEKFRKVLTLARYPNIYLKIPGFGELMPRPIPTTHPAFDLKKAPPVIDMAIDAFGANRLTIGTDALPVYHREGYANVLYYLREYLTRRSRAEQEAILGGKAASLFRFAPAV